MANVFGKVKSLYVSVPVENESETLALMEANFKLHPELMVKWELIGYDCRGQKHKVEVHEIDGLEMNEFVGLEV